MEAWFDLIFQNSKLFEKLGGGGGAVFFKKNDFF